MPITLVWRTDVHLSDRAPSSRTDDWAEAVFAKLSQVRELAHRLNARAIIDGGDFFHVKNPGRNSHELVRRVVDHHATYRCPVFSVPGNHDCVYGDYAFLPQQPLGVLYSSGTFRRLYDENDAVFEDPEDGTVVKIVGVPYHGSSYDLERFRSITGPEGGFTVCAAHVLASKDGGSMFEGEDIVRYADLVGTVPDVFLFGHWHKDQGVDTIDRHTFVNVGSLTRGSLSQDEVSRRPACVILRFVKGQPVDVKVVRLRVREASEVFDVEGRQRQVRHQEDMDTFVTRIRDGLVPVQGGVPITDVVKGVKEVSDAVKERALAYLERV